MELGLHAAGNHLYFAVGAEGAADELRHIGRMELSIHADRALRRNDAHGMDVLVTAVRSLITRFGITKLRVLLPSDLECWATLPKLAYDIPDEREAAIGTLMWGRDRSDAVAVWHDMVNRDFRLLTLRSKVQLAGYLRIADLVAEADIASEFEMAHQWIGRQASKGGILMVGCHENRVTIVSFTLGKIRAATWFPLEDPADLTYFWPHTAAMAGWMSGVHDQTILYGARAWKLVDILTPFLDKGTHVRRLDTLPAIGVAAPEDTYGFSLEEAYPALMLALG